MTDKPILFSAPMVRAILREIEAPGTGKTMTRRVISKRSALDALSVFGPKFLIKPGNADLLAYYIGDRLWVRESVKAVENAFSYERHVEYLADNSRSPAICGEDDDSSDAFVQWWRLLAYRADDPQLCGGKTVPPIHMPRWASRIALIVTNVKVERLQDISEEDARAEGVECGSDGWRDYEMPTTQCCISASDSFRTLWDSLNAKREGGKYAWAANPWVAVYSFRPILGNIDQIAEAA